MAGRIALAVVALLTAASATAPGLTPAARVALAVVALLETIGAVCAPLQVSASTPNGRAAEPRETIGGKSDVV